MKPNLRRNLPGTFVARDLEQGAWRLSRREPSPVDILLRGAHSDAADILREPGVTDIELEWRDATVLLTMTSAQRRVSFKTRSAIVHEPLPSLYDVLPLAGFDSNTKRFWGRVFRLVRIPGGRYLLGVLARRSRDRH
ncbi:MAG: hypothetical protein ABJD53_15300 [Gammaproteobacteria bacterium]